MLRTIIAVTVIAAFSITSASAATRGNTGCYLYKDENFRGSEWALWGSNVAIADFNSKRGWNDEVSSARVIGNCNLMLYEHNGFRGAGVYINTEIARLRTINGGFNDEASSAKCTCS